METPIPVRTNAELAAAVQDAAARVRSLASAGLAGTRRHAGALDDLTRTADLLQARRRCRSQSFRRPPD